MRKAEWKAITERHSVRKYKDIPIPEEIREELQKVTDACNEESGLRIRIIYDNPQGFDTRLVHYGMFTGVNSYILLAGKDQPAFEEKCGYYGEKIVLRAQMLGLNTCWTALTFNKKAVKELLEEGERFCMVIALGYGENTGVPHKSRKASDLIRAKGEMPDWFKRGAKAAMLAPTAMNQQKFRIELDGDTAKISAAGLGIYTKVDLGIVKYHFEAGSGVRMAP